MRLKQPPPQINLLDRVIAYVAPRAAARRLVARHQLALAGGYNGARKDKAALSSWRTSAGSPDSDIIADLPTLRDRCADLERNAPVGAAVINTHASHVIGTGLACSPQIDGDYLRLTKPQVKAWQADVKRRFRAWATSPDCDLARHLNFYGLQDQALRGTLSRGDIFTLTPRVERAGRKRLALQMLEADRVANPMGSSNTATLTEGIDHSAETGEALRYHVLDHHPGDLGKIARGGQWVAARGEATGRRNVLHLFKQLRPGLRRGVPMLAPVLEPIKQITRYTEAELEAAVVSGLFAVFLRMDPQAFGDLFDTDSQRAIVDKASQWSGELEGGKAVNLLPGEEPVTSNPGRPNAQFDPFVASCMRQIGMAIGLPYEVLVMSYQSSYSAAKGALLMAWRFFMGWRDWMATGFCQPVYELWLAEEVAEGRIAAPGFFADDVVRAAWCSAVWVGDGPGSLDPEKEVRAARGRVELGISTLQSESLLHDGVDWETKHRQAVEENEARRSAGLVVHGAAEPVAAAPEQDVEP
jgi:lambda family phage portal protein